VRGFASRPEDFLAIAALGVQVLRLLYNIVPVTEVNPVKGPILTRYYHPPLLVVSDIQTIQVHTNFNNRDTGQVFLESVSSFLRSVSAFERPIEDDGPRIAPPEAPPERDHGVH